MKRALRGAGLYLVLLLVIFFGVRYSANQTVDVKTMEFSKVYKELKAGNVKSLHIIDETGIEGTLKNSKVKFKSYIPSEVRGENLSKDLLNGVQKNNLVLEGESPWIVEMIPTILLLIFMAVAFFVLMNQSQGGGGGRMMNFSKSKAKLHKGDEKVNVVFDDVAGLNEEKDELQEVVDFLKNPKKYMDLGARIPKGILMVGPPGTGKTYLSKAVAGEAGVPFFSISGSDFVEMFVGVGASRVRDLFEQAKKESPAIVFIDEIDAVGRKRGAGLGGGHDEREQTLNQLLVEMDGFGINQGIIIMAATNRPDILDPALLRPGRFDRQVVVGRPDVKGREAIFRVHSRKKPLADDVDLAVLAKFTAGFTPADIENVMNEAAILTARKRENKISMETIEEAITKTVVGVAKKSRIITEKERNLVHQVTIIPRGMAGGFTMQLPTEDKYYATKGEMLQELIVLLGGRVSEEINLDDISTGASNDLERVTSLARSMVTKYGMSSKLGPLTFDSSDEVFLGNSIGHSRQYSEEVASEIDVEVRKIVVDAYEKTREILKSNQERLDYIAKALLEYETLNDKQFEEAFEMRLSLGQNDKSEEDSTPEKTANDSKPVISEDTGSENRMPASQDLVNEDKATILQDLACDDNTVSEDRIDEE